MKIPLYMRPVMGVSSKQYVPGSTERAAFLEGFLCKESGGLLQPVRNLAATLMVDPNPEAYSIGRAARGARGVLGTMATHPVTAVRAVFGGNTQAMDALQLPTQKKLGVSYPDYYTGSRFLFRRGMSISQPPPPGYILNSDSSVELPRDMLNKGKFSLLNRYSTQHSPGRRAYIYRDVYDVGLNPGEKLPLNPIRYLSGKGSSDNRVNLLRKVVDKTLMTTPVRVEGVIPYKTNFGEYERSMGSTVEGRLPNARPTKDRQEEPANTTPASGRSSPAQTYLQKGGSLSDWAADTAGKALETRGGQWAVDKYLDRQSRKKPDPEFAARVFTQMLSNPELRSRMAGSLWDSVKSNGRTLIGRGKGWSEEHPYMAGMAASGIPLLMWMAYSRLFRNRDRQVTVNLVTPTGSQVLEEE